MLLYNLLEQNILVGDDGEPFLIDFGSVRRAEVQIRHRKDVRSPAFYSTVFLFG